MYILYDVMEILRQMIQILVMIGGGVAVVFVLFILWDLHKFLNKAADMGIEAMEKLNYEIDHLDESMVEIK